MKVWEAARATSAAPRYFRPFHHKPTGHIFTDGALNYNNPVEIADMETRLLWPHHPHPDILLSIGTGSEMETTPDEESEKPIPNGWSPLDYVRRISDIVRHQAQENMNPQKAWDNFITKYQHTDEGTKEKYVRLSVTFPNLPKLDHFDHLDSLISEAKKFCEEHDTFMRNTTTKLIASLFYLRLDKVEPDRTSQNFHCKGKLRVPILLDNSNREKGGCV